MYDQSMRASWKEDPRKQCHPILLSAAATLKFDGANSMNLVFRDGVTHEADDILLRFRTREQSGVLLTTVHDRSADKLDVLLEGGRVSQ